MHTAVSMRASPVGAWLFLSLAAAVGCGGAAPPARTPEDGSELALLLTYAPGADAARVEWVLGARGIRFETSCEADACSLRVEPARFDEAYSAAENSIRAEHLGLGLVPRRLDPGP